MGDGYNKEYVMAKQETELKIVQDEPTVEAETSEADLNIFFRWDELSTRLASSGQMNPPWFRVCGLDDGELLLFTPLGTTDPEEEIPQDLWDASRWEEEGAQIAKIVGPTKGMIDKLIAATDNDKQAEDVSVELIEQCLQALPETFCLKRPFAVGQRKILDTGDKYPAPWKVRELAGEGLQGDDLVNAYVLKCLPKMVRDMVHTGALCMAVPETDFMVAAGHEKGTTDTARMVDNPRAKEAGDDENFGEGFSGASEQK